MLSLYLPSFSMIPSTSALLNSHFKARIPQPLITFCLVRVQLCLQLGELYPTNLQSLTPLYKVCDAWSLAQFGPLQSDCACSKVSFNLSASH